MWPPPRIPVANEGVFGKPLLKMEYSKLLGCDIGGASEVRSDRGDLFP